jgi:hypothetical protein
MQTPLGFNASDVSSFPFLSRPAAATVIRLGRDVVDARLAAFGNLEDKTHLPPRG